jgi:hypothetical protein
MDSCFTLLLYYEYSVLSAFLPPQIVTEGKTCSFPRDIALMIIEIIARRSSPDDVEDVYADLQCKNVEAVLGCKTRVVGAKRRYGVI